jgi:hypothetical protein
MPRKNKWSGSPRKIHNNLAAHTLDWEKNLKPNEDPSRGIIYHKPGSNKK